MINFVCRIIFLFIEIQYCLSIIIIINVGPSSEVLVPLFASVGKTDGIHRMNLSIDVSACIMCHVSVLRYLKEKREIKLEYNQQKK